MEKSMAIVPLVRLSGAVARRDSEGVYVKYSSNPAQWDFLNAQAQYMAECGPPFVEILGMAHGRYWMKEYIGILMTDDLSDILWEAKKSLKKLWTSQKPRYVDRNWRTAHMNRLSELFEINTLEPRIGNAIYESFEKNVVENEHRLTVCGATHGDATLSNVVYSNDREIRWIDPIPPSLWLPAFRAVDLGKLMQSSHGWEFVMNGFELPERCDSVVLQDESVVDMMAAHYFHALCYLRILRYATRGDIAHNYAMGKLNEFFLAR